MTTSKNKFKHLLQNGPAEIGHTSVKKMGDVIWHEMSQIGGMKSMKIRKNSKVEPEWHFRLQSGTEQLVALLFMLWVSTQLS